MIEDRAVAAPGGRTEGSGEASQKPCVLIYRSELLTYSETFITAQAGATRTYSPIFAGMRRLPRSLALPAESLVVVEGDSFLERVRRYAFLLTGHAPGLVAGLRKRKPVLLHAHFATDAAEALPLARALGIPLVATLHGYDVMADDATHRGNRRGRVYLARRQRLFREASLFVCVSQAIRVKALQRGYPADKLRVLPIGIDVAQFQTAPHLTRAPAILFVGRLVEKKGCVHLVRAMGEVRRVLPEARLVILGDGPERASLEAEARRWGSQAVFLGVQSAEQVRRWMASSRVLAAPSITAHSGDAEGLPTVLYEALAMGLPVACFRSSGIPELVRDGVEGLLAEEGDETALGQNLLRLCQEEGLGERMGAAGRLRMEQSFALGPLTAQLEALYTEVVGRALQPQSVLSPEPSPSRIVPAPGASCPEALHSSVVYEGSNYPDGDGRNTRGVEPASLAVPGNSGPQGSLAGLARLAASEPSKAQEVAR